MRGVDIFFVLSGFLVSGLFFKELAQRGTVSPGHFLIRRAFKIYPAFWLLILVTAILRFLQSGQVSLKALFAELFFYQNYVTGLWLHTWTLAIEEHFYLILAGLFFALKQFAGPEGKVNLKVIPRVFDVAIISCLAAKILTWWFSPGINSSNYQWFDRVTHVRIDALFFGMWLAHLWHNCWDEKMKARVLSFRYLWAGVGLLLISSLGERVMGMATWYIFGFILVYLGAGCLLIASLSLDYCRCPVWFNWIAWLGRHSYSVYLWHMLVLEWLHPVLGAGSSSMGVYLMKEFICHACCWSAGILTARLVEIPMLRLRDRLFPGRD
jgi:peptidoglycan/LPS O-acetylase OafA/YrhL